MNNKYKLVCLSHTKEPFTHLFEYGSRKRIKTERDCRDAVYLSAGQAYEEWDEIYLEIHHGNWCLVEAIKQP